MLEGIEQNRKLTFPVQKSNKSRLGGKLRYWWCWFVAGSLLLFIATPALIFLWIINRRIWLYPLAKWGAKTWLRACGARVKVTGFEHIDPNRSYVFASNHRSYLDTATLFFCAGQKMGLVAKKELLKIPVLGQGIGFVNIIAIDRTNAERALHSMQKARDVMADGYSFGVFVEGTRGMPGELLPFKKGPFYMALDAGVPIVPMTILGTRAIWPKGSMAIKPGTATVVFHPPIDPKQFPEREALMDAVRASIASAM